jgi:hypothetical protein
MLPVSLGFARIFRRVPSAFGTTGLCLPTPSFANAAFANAAFAKTQLILSTQ